MLRIEREFNGFRLRLPGDRRRYHAQTIEATCEGVKHYFGDRGTHDETACPLCASIQRDIKKDSRKGA